MDDHVYMCQAFFGYAKYSSLSGAFLATGLPTGDTILLNCQFRLREELLSSDNKLVKIFRPL